MRARACRDIALRILKNAQSALIEKRPITHAVFFPVVATERDLSDLVNRASWHFPLSAALRDFSVTVPVTSKLYKKFRRIDSIPLPPDQGASITKGGKVRLRCIDTEEQLADLLNEDAILVWDYRAMERNPRLFFRLHKIWIVDPSFYSITETRNYIRLFNEALPPGHRQALLERSKDQYDALLETGRAYRKSYVFGTGSSVRKAHELSFDDGFRIACNTIIKDKKLLEHINLHAIVALGDFILHIGPSLTADDFRRHVKRVIRNYDFSWIVREEVAPFVLAHFPELEDRLIGIPHSLWSPFNFPARNRFFVKTTLSSLTTLLLPVASAATNTTYILGSDGKPEAEQHAGKPSAWKQPATLEYCFRESIAKVHPSRVRDFDPEVYYKKHCQILEQLLRYGESVGKRYVSLAPSYIPALQKRQATEAQSD